MAVDYTFRKAVRGPVAMLIGVAGNTGGGKTKTMLELATGMADGKPIFGIDTENGRMTYYADEYDFNHLNLKPPFTPENYLGAVQAAEKAGAGAIVIDSGSHEWNGIGGCQDMQEEILERMTGGDADKMEKMSALAWKKPKASHRALMQHLIQSNVHILIGLRAEDKLKVTKEKNDRTGKSFSKFHDSDWTPICEKHFMYEMTVSFMLNDRNPGVPIPIKIQGNHKHAFRDGQQVDRATGKRLVAWANAGKTGNAAAMVLRDGAGAEVKKYERAGAYLDGLEDVLNKSGDPEGAQAVWDQNMDTFYAIQKAAQEKGNADALKRCQGIGLLIARLVNPVQQEA